MQTCSKRKKMIRVFSVVSVVLLQMYVVRSDEQPGDHCILSQVENAKKECADVYGGGKESNLETICTNLDCYLECLKDAIGDCDRRDMFFKEDIKVLKVLLRAKCANIKLTREAERSCTVNTPCIDEIFHQENVAVMNSLHGMHHDAQTKALDCRMALKTIQCIDVKTTANCTSEMANLVKDLEVVKNSLSKCDIQQTHHLFKAYKGDINCKNSKLDSKCFTASVMERLSKCKPVTLESFLSKDAWDDICDDVDCTSECYEEAIGECGKKEQFVMLDPEMIKISTRAACAHIEDLKDTMERCKPSTITCMTDMHKAVVRANQQLLQSQRYKEYKNVICSASEAFRSCISINVTDDCNEGMAELATNMHKAWHSYTACGPIHSAIPSAFLHKYDGDLECGGSPQLHVALSNILFSVAIYLFVKF